MSQLSKTRAFLQESGLDGPSVFQGRIKEDLAEIAALIHPNELPTAFREFHRYVGCVPAEVFAHDYRFNFFDVLGNNERCAEDNPQLSSGLFQEIFVFASYPDGYCFYYLKDAVGDAQVPVHVTHENELYRSFPNLDTFLLEYLGGLADLRDLE